MHNIKIGTGVLNKCLQKLKLIKTAFYNLLGKSERKREQFFHFPHNRFKNRRSNHYEKSRKSLGGRLVFPKTAGHCFQQNSDIIFTVYLLQSLLSKS